MVRLTKRSLALPADPPSVSAARVWVASVLSDIGREDLVESAQLGVSELVTNAILHARPPLSIAVSGSDDHPRVEVADGAPGPLRALNLAPLDPGTSPTTVGRGLEMVAMTAVRWGSDPNGAGKLVWFEPAGELHNDDLAREFPELGSFVIPEPVAPQPDGVCVTLLNVPAQLFARLRQYNGEVRRELRLLALSAPDRYPIAVDLTATFRQVDSERRVAFGVSLLDEAIQQGQQTIDLTYVVPATAPSTMGRIKDLLDHCYELFADEHLLCLAPPALLRDLQDWYLGEFVRQGMGAEPHRWSGPVELARSSAS